MTPLVQLRDKTAYFTKQRSVLYSVFIHAWQPVDTKTMIVFVVLFVCLFVSFFLFPTCVSEISLEVNSLRQEVDYCFCSAL